jgi:hypothetical protein
MRDKKMMLAVLFVALPVAATAQTARWIVRSADSTVVGPVLGLAGDPVVSTSFSRNFPVWVARRIPGEWIQLLVSRNAVWATNDRVPFLYEDYDCSGPALLQAPQNTNEVRATVVFDTRVFWPKGPGESRVIRAKGVRVRDTDQCNATLVEPDLCCVALETEQTRFAAEVSSTDVAKLELRAPFRLEPVAGPSK